MIYKQPGSKYCWTQFVWRATTYRKSTGATDKKTARTIEARIRSELALRNYGILQPKEISTLGVFLKERFLSFIESTPTIKAKTQEYYRLGTAYLLGAKSISRLALTEIDETHQAGFAALNKYSVSTLNRNLRTLRHALRLARKCKVQT